MIILTLASNENAFQASQGYTVRTLLKQKQKQTTKPKFKNKKPTRTTTTKKTKPKSHKTLTTSKKKASINHFKQSSECFQCYVYFTG